MNIKHKSDYSIQSVSIFLSLLDQFSQGENEYALSELSNKLEVSKNKVFRMLATLELNEYIVKNQLTGGYRLGNKALSLGRAYINSRNVIRESRAVIEELVAKCNETIGLVIFKNDCIIVEDVVMSTHPVRAVLQIGETLRMDCSAAGRIYATFVDIMRNGNVVFLRAGKTKEVLDNGYALFIEGPNTGVVEIAAPIRNYDSNVIGAVSLHGPTTRLVSGTCLDALCQKVKDTAEKISNHMGHIAPNNLCENFSNRRTMVPPKKYCNSSRLKRSATASAF